MGQKNSVNIGDGVTFICSSDRTVGTVIEYSDTMQDITRNKNNAARTLIKGKKGWKVLNHPQRVIVGVRAFHYDLSF